MKEKYKYLKDLGYNRNECKRMATWSWERIQLKIVGGS